MYNWISVVFNHVNSVTAILFTWNFHPHEVVSRWRDPQLQVNENYSDFTRWRSTMLRSWSHVLSFTCLKADNVLIKNQQKKQWRLTWLSSFALHRITTYQHNRADLQRYYGQYQSVMRELIPDRLVQIPVVRPRAWSPSMNMLTNHIRSAQSWTGDLPQLVLKSCRPESQIIDADPALTGLLWWLDFRWCLHHTWFWALQILVTS